MYAEGEDCGSVKVKECESCGRSTEIFGSVGR